VCAPKRNTIAAGAAGAAPLERAPVGVAVVKVLEQDLGREGGRKGGREEKRRDDE